MARATAAPAARASGLGTVGFGAAGGTFAKRLLTIMWAFCGLIALALFQGPTALADPDAAWGALSLQLLGPGLLGLMLVGLLASLAGVFRAVRVDPAQAFGGP